jgi:hypothetical protein
MRVLGTPQGQRLIGELPELPNCLHQFVEGELAILGRLPHASLINDPALKVYRLSSWRWQLDSGCMLEHSSDLLQVLPGTPPRPAGSFQFVDQILKFFRR